MSEYSLIARVASNTFLILWGIVVALMVVVAMRKVLGVIALAVVIACGSFFAFIIAPIATLLVLFAALAALVTGFAAPKIAKLIAAVSYFVVMAISLVAFLAA